MPAPINLVQPPLQVILPAELESFYGDTGYIPVTVSEDRVNARLRVRRQGIIEFEDTPPILAEAVRDREIRGAIIVKDLSRSGVAFLFHEHVYPTERAWVFLQGRRLDVCVKRCRRMGPACYEIGAKIKQVISDEHD